MEDDGLAEDFPSAQPQPCISSPQLHTMALPPLHLGRSPGSLCSKELTAGVQIQQIKLEEGALTWGHMEIQSCIKLV